MKAESDVHLWCCSTGDTGDSQGHHAWVQTQGHGQQPRVHPASSWHHLVVWVSSAPSISSPTESHGEDFPSGKPPL